MKLVYADEAIWLKSCEQHGHFSCVIRPFCERYVLSIGVVIMVWQLSQHILMALILEKCIYTSSPFLILGAGTPVSTVQENDKRKASASIEESLAEATEEEKE